MVWQRKTLAEREQERIVGTRWSDISTITASLRTSDPGAIQRAIDFLEEDPRFHGSGYYKEEIWRRLVHAGVHPKQRRRLESIALRYLDRRVTREFWCMARHMAERGSEAFWDDVR